ncbi:unnamed protein product [Rhizophagus irregularis]|nr:unnamed protein product [Rhizophagus irregularis]
MNITSKLKNSPRPKGLPKFSYLPYSSLPPPTHVDSRDFRTDWLKNSMQYGLPWFNYISGFMGRLTETITGRTDVIVAKFAWNFSGKLRIIPVNWGKLCYNFGIMEDLQFGKFCQNGGIPTEFLIQMLRNFSVNYH